MEVVTEKEVASPLKETFARLKERSLTLRTEPLINRKQRLQKLRAWIHENRKAIHQAMHADFRKAPQEVDAIEIFHVLSEIKLALERLSEWAAPRKVDAPVTLLGTRSYIQYEPKGVCLIISPWNYPFSLAVGPLVSALAAGNTVIVKPSEMTPHVSALLTKMASEIFDRNVVTVVEGAADTSQLLLSLPFDHIFFTGSPAVGKIVMRAAAEHLTSVTLELGGKSPVFVTENSNVKEAAKRITVGKFVNNGQTCVAPDYILVHESVAATLVKEIIQSTNSMFGGGKALEESSSYCRIVNTKHLRRLTALVEDAVSKGAKVEWQGKVDEKTCFFHPVILSNVPGDAAMLEEEIFGPVLPIIPYKKTEEAISFVNRRPKPLALYVFSSSRREQQHILSSTSAGGACINDCGIHFLHHNLPFGGVNNSGIGKSHGHFGFLAFSNEKGVLKQRSGLTTLKPFYPPYTSFSQRLMDWFLKLF
jgi:aldehyde dehydrogenase (NAD+)